MCAENKCTYTAYNSRLGWIGPFGALAQSQDHKGSGRLSLAAAKVTLSHNYRPHKAGRGHSESVELGGRSSGAVDSHPVSVGRTPTHRLIHDRLYSSVAIHY